MSIVITRQLPRADGQGNKAVKAAECSVVMGMSKWAIAAALRGFDLRVLTSSSVSSPRYNRTG